MAAGRRGKREQQVCERQGVWAAEGPRRPVWCVHIALALAGWMQQRAASELLRTMLRERTRQRVRVGSHLLWGLRTRVWPQT